MVTNVFSLARPKEGFSVNTTGVGMFSSGIPSLSVPSGSEPSVDISFTFVPKGLVPPATAEFEIFGGAYC